MEIKVYGKLIIDDNMIDVQDDEEFAWWLRILRQDQVVFNHEVGDFIATLVVEELK